MILILRSLKNCTVSAEISFVEPRQSKSVRDLRLVKDSKPASVKLHPQALKKIMRGGLKDMINRHL